MGFISGLLLLAAAAMLAFSPAPPFFDNSAVEIEFTFHTIQPLKMINSVGFSIFTGLCNQPPPSILGPFHHLRKKPCPWRLSSASPALSNPESTFCLRRMSCSGRSLQMEFCNTRPIVSDVTPLA